MGERKKFFNGNNTENNDKHEQYCLHIGEHFHRSSKIMFFYCVIS